MKHLAFLLFLLLPLSSSAQELAWDTLNVPPTFDRYNDLCFLDPMTGWAILPAEGATGKVYHTTDGGDTWTVQLEMSQQHFRSIAFLDKQKGFVATLGFEPPCMFATTDGGSTWDTIFNFIGPPPHGICGMRAVDDQTVVGIGKVFGPVHFVRTTDAGATWHSQVLPENIKSGIDCHFWSRDSGIVVGGTSDRGSNSHSIVLGTTDGGTTWTERFRGTDSLEWCWKISFPTPDLGYVAIEDNYGESNFLTTTDRGMTWQERSMHIGHTAFQGIGFITDSIGWTGGRRRTMFTTDGGATWDTAALGPRNVNRFKFFGDTLGYAAGKGLYRLKRASTKATVAIPNTEEVFFFDAYSQQLSSKKSIIGTVTIADVTGRVRRQENAVDLLHGVSLVNLPKGAYFISFNGSKVYNIKIIK